ncbi:DUF29 domain-containing protein [Nodosilinea sp. PGN35]|uniref:DUF29 domain-containing protein n=1 Tax=Nodosilinea sp. PGN35 TaxID=3020489 RepID=UPI0023B2994C|nr:DUF29 domain-containing protein [Nodosilinea sp. TSF1-S3]MDF0365501.1 DUF29 domain-containing protein [Nodosilinea sp. TSF1-S3]
MSLYDTDFYAWTQTQAKTLKAGLWEALDIENLVEELETLGRQERQELQNRLGILLGHLLKWQWQPENRSNSWRSTIREQRRRIDQLLADSPSLKPFLPEAGARAYQDGLDLAVRETGLDYEAFPNGCPYSLTQALAPDFWP